LHLESTVLERDGIVHHYYYYTWKNKHRSQALTCQLMRDDRFSTMSLWSVRTGGPYLTNTTLTFRDTPRASGQQASCTRTRSLCCATTKRSTRLNGLHRNSLSSPNEIFASLLDLFYHYIILLTVFMFIYYCNVTLRPDDRAIADLMCNIFNIQVRRLYDITNQVRNYYESSKKLLRIK